MSQRHLRVKLHIQGERGYFGSFLPMSVIDARGQVVATGAVNTARVTEFHYECNDAPLFARLTLPNGTSETIPLQTGDHAWLDEVSFNIGDDTSTSDWMAWSAIRLDLKRHGGALMNQPGMKNAWFQLWEKTPDSPRWMQIDINEQLSDMPHSREAIQLELRGSPHPRALVVRLDSDTPQVVSIPNEQTSVLITSLRTLSGVLTPRVIVGSYSPNAEAIMEFLRAGKLGQLESMLDPGSDLAHRLLRGKIIDPIAATAAAYYLLRKRDWERMPTRWLDNLTNWNDRIPDAKLIRAACRIQRGLPMAEACNLAAETLASFLEQGIPLFAEASTLLSDLLALAEKAEQPLSAQTAKTLRMMVASAHPSGLSFGFTGKSPDKPLPVHTTFEQNREIRHIPAMRLSSVKIVEHPALEDTLRPREPNGKASRRQWRAKTITLSRSVKAPLSIPQQTISGSAAKTLFLQQVLDETVLISP